jgi:hypothetical protein
MAKRTSKHTAKRDQDVTVPPNRLGRGVWEAAWDGPNGETVLLAVTSTHRLLMPPTFVPIGWSEETYCDALWEALDAADPENDALARASVPKAGRGSSLLSSWWKAYHGQAT